jgi:hypothetical protein
MLFSFDHALLGHVLSPEFPPLPWLSISHSCEPSLSPLDASVLLLAAQLAFGDKPSILAHIAEDASFGHLLAEALEQALLRLTWP